MLFIFILDFNSFFIPSFVTSQSKLDLYYHEFFPIQLSSRIWWFYLSLSSSFPRIFFLSRLQLCLITSRNFRVEDFLKKRGRGKRNCSEELLKLGDSRSMMRYHENGKRYTFEKLQWRGKFLCQRNELPRWIRNGTTRKSGRHNEGNVFRKRELFFPNKYLAFNNAEFLFVL